MLTKAAKDTKSLLTEELRSIAAVSGPCVTVMMPVESAPTAEGRNRNRLNKAVRDVEEALEKSNVDADVKRQLLAGLDTVLEDFDLPPNLKGVVILRSTDTLRCFPVFEEVAESVRVGEHFFVKPLLGLRDENRIFFLLVLNQKNAKLFRCNGLDWTAVAFPAGTPRSLEEAMQTKPPDHNQRNRSTGGASTGSMSGVMFSTSSDREAKSEYLSHFYKALDRGVHEVLRNEPWPLIPAGVEYELALYRQVNTHPHLVEDGLRGASIELDQELQRAAVEIARKAFDGPVNSALAQFENLKGTPRASSNIKEIVKAAHDGRVSHLFVAEGVERPGVLLEETNEVRTHREPEPGDEDVINLAVIHALLTSSEIYQLPRNRMPHGMEMAALLRF